MFNCGRSRSIICRYMDQIQTKWKPPDIKKTDQGAHNRNRVYLHQLVHRMRWKLCISPSTAPALVHFFEVSGNRACCRGCLLMNGIVKIHNQHSVHIYSLGNDIDRIHSKREKKTIYYADERHRHRAHVNLIWGRCERIMNTWPLWLITGACELTSKSAKRNGTTAKWLAFCSYSICDSCICHTKAPVPIRKFMHYSGADRSLFFLRFGT